MEQAPPLWTIARGALGFVMLGIVGSLDPQAPLAAPAQAPAGLLVHVGALALTGPTLLVAHPFLGLEAPPEALVAALARGFARAGDLALGLVPFLLFFAATTGIAPVLLALLLFFVGGVALVSVGRELVAAERDANPDMPSKLGTMRALAVGWCVLTLLAAARVGMEVLS